MRFVSVDEKGLIFGKNVFCILEGFCILRFFILFNFYVNVDDINLNKFMIGNFF